MTDFGNVKIIVCEDYKALSIAGADIVTGQIQQKPDSVIGFATGSTPEGLYQELIHRYEEKKLSFEKVTAFNLDEYYPMRKDNPQSYDYFMREKLFSKINIPRENCHIPNGETNDVPGECSRYESLIATRGGIDLQILGIGTNGHIGFNEPAAAFEKETRLVNLVESTIEANARFFTSPVDVPRYGITMGMKSIMLSKKILLLASGENKAKALHMAIYGNIDPMVPASILQLHQDVTIVVDKAAEKGVKKGE